MSLIAFAVSWVSYGTGVVRNDPARNIYIPDELDMPLQIKAAYNGREGFFMALPVMAKKRPRGRIFLGSWSRKWSRR